ncbi:MAG: DNA-3-methyladenine glycosylase family protein [Gammaproteobacteria bacterium]
MTRFAALTPALIRRAEKELSAADAVMAKVIAARGPLRLRREKEPPFHVLAVSIINQQLSQKAADAIEKRVAAVIPSPFAAADAMRASPLELRAAGLSSGKVRYLRELADRVQSGAIPLAAFARMADEEIIASLVSCPGVGRWTAEMFLMFAMHRPDIVSGGDAALRRAARILYGKRFRGGDEEVLLKVAQKWRPWRTVASRYLWLSLAD